MPHLKILKAVKLLTYDEIDDSLIGKDLAFLNKRGSCEEILTHIIERTRKPNKIIGKIYKISLIHEDVKQICIQYFNDEKDHEMFRKAGDWMWKPYLIIYEEKEVTSNKGNKECILCHIPTEMKRDFKDFSIREFCPRCKI